MEKALELDPNYEAAESLLFTLQLQNFKWVAILGVITLLGLIVFFIIRKRRRKKA